MNFKHLILFVFIPPFSFAHSISHFITTASNILVVTAQFGRNWSQAGFLRSKHGGDADIFSHYHNSQ
jgi:hypothetical protein